MNAGSNKNSVSSALTHLGRQLVRVEKQNLQVIRSLRTAAIATGLPLVAWAVGQPSAMIPLGVGALFAGLAESNIHPAHRGRIMFWATAWLMATSALGFLVAHDPLMVVLMSGLVAAFTGWVGVAGQRAGIVGVLSLVLFTITAGLPQSVGLSADFVLFVGVGGFVQTVVFLLFYRVRPGNPGPVPQRESRSVWWRIRHPGEQKDTYLRHAISLTIAIVVATALSQYVAVPHEYWIPMTVAWIFKPDHNATSLRVFERITGTLLAIGVAYVWGHFVPAPTEVLFVVCGIGAYCVLAFLTGNYTIATFGVTTFVLALFAIAGDLYEETVIFRLEATLAAGAIVIVVVLLTGLRIRKKA